MTITQYFATEQDMLAFSARVAQTIKGGIILFLYGPLGVGKTTFTRGFLRALGWDKKVKSPTYTLIEPYDIAGRQVFHFDFYRLHAATELNEIGIKDYFFPESICLIEWPEKGQPLLPEPDLACTISFAVNGRNVRIEACSNRGETALKNL